MRNPELRQEKEAAIKLEIKNVFGRNIKTSGDCIDLSNEIYNKIRKKINANTLRRFFGLVKADYLPSFSTLSILSGYCGFGSVDEVGSAQPSGLAGRIEQERMIKYVVSLFAETPSPVLTDKTFLSFIKHTIEFLNHEQVIAGKYISQIIKTKNGQDCFFEHFVNIDKLNSYYGDGLRYYLNEKQDIDGYIFGTSMLAYKYWLSGNDEELRKMSGLLHNKIPVGYIVPPFICGRYYAAKLFCASVFSQGPEEVLIGIYKFYTSAEANSRKDGTMYFEYVIAEALVLTGYYHDALHYLNQFGKNRADVGYTSYTLDANNFRLLEAIAYFKINKATEAELIFDEIKPSEFHFLTKKFAGILYIALHNELKRKSVKLSGNMQALIEETGFKKLENIFVTNQH
ncbi:MAG: hypothetical protein ABJB86_02715 [Bacteroidota bacterium]